MNCVATRDPDDGPKSNPRSASLLATCTHCEKLHRAAPLDFNPVCSACAADSSYARFAYSYASSPAIALEKELRNYDDFGRRGGLGDEQPPARRPDDAGNDPAWRR